MKRIEVKSFEEYAKAIKALRDDAEALIANPPEDLNECAKAWRKQNKKYWDYRQGAVTKFKFSDSKACKKKSPVNADCIKCGNESCARYWWEILNNELFDVYVDGENSVGRKIITEICTELGITLLEVSDYKGDISGEELIKKAVKERKTGDLYYISLRSPFGCDFPYIVYEKAKKDGTKPSGYKYTKLYSPNKVYSGSITAEDIKQLLTSKFEL